MKNRYSDYQTDNPCTRLTTHVPDWHILSWVSQMTRGIATKLRAVHVAFNILLSYHHCWYTNWWTILIIQTKTLIESRMSVGHNYTSQSYNRLSWTCKKICIVHSITWGKQPENLWMSYCVLSDWESLITTTNIHVASTEQVCGNNQWPNQWWQWQQHQW